MEKQRNGLVFILDRSGSMKDILGQTITNYNAHLEEMRKVDGLEWTLVQFDTIGTDTVHARIAVKDVPELTKETFQPRAGTPLIDAACITIDRAIDKYAQTDRVIITILTDGQENSSREYTMADLHDRIKTITGWGWQVVFLGANIDAYADAGKAGIAVTNTVSYNAKDPQMAMNAFKSLSTKARAFYASGATMDWSEQEKLDAGDAFIKTPKPAPVQAPKAQGGAAPTKTLVDKPAF